MQVKNNTASAPRHLYARMAAQLIGPQNPGPQLAMRAICKLELALTLAQQPAASTWGYSILRYELQGSTTHRERISLHHNSDVLVSGSELAPPSWCDTQDNFGQKLFVTCHSEGQ